MHLSGQHIILTKVASVQSAFGNSTSSCMRLRSGGAKSWAGSIRQRSSSGMSASTEDRSCVWLWPMQANLQSATCPGRRRRGRGCAVICRRGLHIAQCTIARLLWSRCRARLQEEGREALCSTDPILCTCWTFPPQSSVQLP